MSNDRTAKLRAEVLDRVAQHAERGFDDTRFDFLRPLSTRRAVVIATFGALGLYALSGAPGLSGLQLPALALYFALIWLLRVATRHVTDLPDGIVDERLRQVRGYTYRYAYLGALAAAALVVAAIGGYAFVSADGLATPIHLGDALHSALVVFFAAMVLPNAVYAWSEPEI